MDRREPSRPMSPYEKIFESIPEVYKIHIKDISSSLNIPFDDNSYFLDFSVVNDFSPEELSKLLFSTLSWLEHINYKKTLVEGILAIKNNELENLYSNLYMEIKAQNNDPKAKKITNADIENTIKSTKDYNELQTKIDLYEAYLKYLSGMYEILEMFHYAVKHKISLLFSNEKKASLNIV